MAAQTGAGQPSIAFDVLMFEQQIAAACAANGIVDNATRTTFVNNATQAQMNAFTKILMNCFTIGPARP